MRGMVQGIREGGIEKVPKEEKNRRGKMKAEKKSWSLGVFNFLMITKFIAFIGCIILF